MLESGKVSIEQLIEIVKNGGSVRTGIDVFNDRGVLLLEKDVRVEGVKPLEVIKNAGITHVPVNTLASGGLWDKNGTRLLFSEKKVSSPAASSEADSESVEKRIAQINEIKRLAGEKHAQAKDCIRQIVEEIKKSGGEFDYQAVEDVVTDLLSFLEETENGFSYLTHEISSYDEYLYNHSINVCTVGAAAMQKFNRSFSDAVNFFLNGMSFEVLKNKDESPEEVFVLFNKEEIRNIAIGFFLHDVGKVTIPDKVMNKTGPLSREEYDLARRHSFDKGEEILEKSGIQDTHIRNIVRYHHCKLYMGETNCYPEDFPPAQVPPYVKICKMADIYDAMTSKRCYNEALNPISVVTELFRKYANKNRLLQFIVDSFVRTVGIYPVGSIVTLRNGQKVCVIDSKGPIVVPFTSKKGTPFSFIKAPLNIGEAEKQDPEFGIDRRATLASSAEEYRNLPKQLQPSSPGNSPG